jgi:PQQ-dependent dehydrogenase (methanol/ethanol family)
VKRVAFLLAALVYTSAAGATPNGRNSAAVTIPPAPAFAPLELATPASVDWPTHGGDYGQTRYSALRQVTRSNVRRLRPAWHLRFGGSGVGSKYKGEGTPLVYNGVMYTVTGANDVFAIDAAKGTILWRYDAHLPPTITTVCCGWANRGLALGDGRVYVARMDATLVALSQQDGHILWMASNGNPQDGYTMTMAPLYYNGLVIVGVSGGEFGARGSVSAFDARDGHLVWRFYTVPAPGQLGSDTWPPDSSWQTGGATVWNTPSVDPRLGLLYFTTGNAYPWSTRGAGDNLFTSSFVAVDPATGAYRWHYQVVHHDIWDYDCASNTVLFATRIRGLVRRVVAEPCKTGWVYELNRRTGRPVLDIEEKPVPQSAFQNTSPTQPIPSGDSFATQCARTRSFPSQGPDGRRYRFGCVFTPFDDTRFTAIAPGAAGANSWSPSSYSPQTHSLYVCSRETQSAYKAIPAASGTYSGGRAFVGAWLGVPFVKRITPGALTAIDVRTNRVSWRRVFRNTVHGQVDASCLGGSLATAGGLVFLGLPQGVYHGLAAFDAKTGKRLWRWPTAAGTEAPPISYSVGGKQYVAVFAGGRVGHGLPVVKGDDIYAFTLGGK